MTLKSNNQSFVFVSKPMIGAKLIFMAERMTFSGSVLSFRRLSSFVRFYQPNALESGQVTEADEVSVFLGTAAIGTLCRFDPLRCRKSAVIPKRARRRCRCLVGIITKHRTGSVTMSESLFLHSTT